MSAAPRAYATPMMRQYMRLKEEHPGALMLFRCGDFYETYAEDAEEAGRLLNITVTRKGAGADGEVAMAGVPYHAIDAYLAKLVRSGRSVAIAEQLEDPKAAKGLVQRGVVRVVTPGTAIDETIVDERAPNHIVCLERSPAGVWGIALADLGTGFFALSEATGDRVSSELATELARLDPRELLVSSELDLAPLRGYLADRPVAVTRRHPSDFRHETALRVLTDHFRVHSLDGFGATELPVGTAAAGALLRYLQETQKTSLRHLHRLRVRTRRETMLLDATTQRSLELVRNLHDGGRAGTLLSVLDHTQTPMGARLLRSWILEPLRDREAIEARLDAVGELVASRPLRESLAAALAGVRDLERAVARVNMGTAGPRDLAALRSGLQRLPALRLLLGGRGGGDAALLEGIAARIDPLEGLAEALARTLVDEPPAVARDGGLVREGASEALDKLLRLSRGAKDWINQFREEETQRIGVAVKVQYNRVFGYYIEMTRAQLRQLPGGQPPPEYIRKQTIANGERFITAALKEKEDEVLHAEERMRALELEIFQELCGKVSAEAPALLANAAAVAEADCLLSLATAAVRGGYRRPGLNADGILEIQSGRHPVLESIQKEPPFVPNDAALAPEARIGLITGPNMAGKSTFIRQSALLVLMAHMGSFVPAERALVPLRDRVFTRVGAMDSLARGQSTFLVEMSELANILQNATDDSLVILDEIGRGTSTYDGLSIAWAACEFIHNTEGQRPLTLFATHYHELTELANALPALRNFHVAVADRDGRIVFLYRIVPGATDRSYGVHAAELAGVPDAVVARSREILAELEEGRSVAPRVASEHPKAPAPKPRRRASILPQATEWDLGQLSLFGVQGPHPALEALKRLDPNRLTPMEALMELQRLAEEARREP
ncbi:MAG: DNA mismatch repair protein MutS [Candidatus Sumerlaeia bacterium]|nr:DNA mismatch repair protein MutS [Candidatus Sumerlaeia bacterium]